MRNDGSKVRRTGYNERQKRQQQRATRRQRTSLMLGWLQARGWKYILAVLLSATAVWQGWYWVRRLNPGQMLTLKNIEIEGNQLMGWDEVLQSAGVEVGMPMGQIATDTIQMRLEKQSRVVSAEVTRSFPSTLVIHLQEAQSLFLKQTAKGWKVYSEKGTELPVLASASLPLPVVDAEGRTATRLSADFLRELRACDSLLYGQVSQIRPSMDLKYLQVIFRNTEHKVLFAAAPGRAEAFRHYRLLVQGIPVQLADVQTVDMRFQGFAYTILHQKGPVDG